MATIDSLLRDEPKDISPADTPAPKDSTNSPDDPCCTPPGGDPGPDR